MQYDKRIGEGWDTLLKKQHFPINWPTTGGALWNHRKL